MRVACPSCAAAYRIPDGTDVARRKLRCSRCGTEWVEEADTAEDGAPERDRSDPGSEPIPQAPTSQASAPSVLAVPPIHPAPTAMERLAMASPPPAAQRLALSVAWAVSVLGLGLLVAASIIWQPIVAEAWPPSQRVYAAFGLTGSAAK